MRVLHTADWHVGKKLGRLDRLDEAHAAISDVVEVARSERVDAVLVAGDLFDRAGPPLESLRLVLEGLRRLADTGAQVVAIPGNHDSPELFRVLAPLLQGIGVTLVHKPLEPSEGGIVTVPGRDEKSALRVACVPFVHETQVIDLMGLPSEGFKAYADRIRRITSYYARWMCEHTKPGCADVLMGHFMVHGAMPSGTERELHIGEAYMATAEAIPSDMKYAALGHIHRPQEAPGSSVPARFCGSLMQLDFGEAAQPKSVCLLEIGPGPRPVRVETVPITSGRKLLKVHDSLDGLRARTGEFADAYLHVSVATEGPSPGLADEVRSFLPNALHVVADYPRAAAAVPAREGRSLSDLYRDYRVGREGAEPSAELMDGFEGLLEAVGVSW